MESAYTSLKAEFRKTGTYDEKALLELVERVEAKSGKKAVIYGTRTALANLRREDNRLADMDKDAISRQGYIGTFFGTALVEIPQSVDRADQFMIDGNMLYVIPDGTKIIKLLFEGDVDVVEVSNPATRMDMQFEYMFMRRLQLGVCKASVYGIYAIGR